jgi:hypothetical protein
VIPLPAYGTVLDVPCAVLGDLATMLRPGGRLVLDVYYREFFQAHHGEVLNRGVRERKTLQGGRLVTELFYDDLVEVLACSGFDETVPPSPRAPRMQHVFVPG